MGADNKYMSEYVKNRYVKMKLDAIEYKGGKCMKCGYNKCYAAMQFHHRDPTEKEFEWTQLRKRNFETIKLELDKCDLLCCRCHAEVHHDYEISKRALDYLKKKQDNRISHIRDFNRICEFCKKPFLAKPHDKSTRRFCSMDCVHDSRMKAKALSPDELAELVWKIPSTEIAKRFGVSDKAVEKWCKKYGLEKPGPGYWRKSWRKEMTP